MKLNRLGVFFKFPTAISTNEKKIEIIFLHVKKVKMRYGTLEVKPEATKRSQS